MMGSGMMDGGWGGWFGTGWPLVLAGLLVVAVVVLGVAALLKYLGR